MTSRERIMLALNHQEPDRVPLDLGGSPGNTGIAKKAHAHLLEHLGIQGEEAEVYDVFQQLVKPDEQVLQKFDVDVIGIRSTSPASWKLNITEDRDNYYYTDEWGIKLKMPKRYGYYFDMVEHPLAGLDIDSLKDYQWPDPHDPGRKEGLKEYVKHLYENTGYALFFNAPCSGIFEQSTFLRGHENFYIDLIADPRLAEAIMDKMVEFYLGFWEEMLSIVGKYVQVVKMGDDLGTQKALLISPELYKKYVKPREQEVFSFIKQHTDAKLYFHSCGAIYDLIPDFIELGVDVLNPVQVSANGMDTKRLKHEFGDRLSFWGAIDTQKILPFGHPRDVEYEVKKRIEDFAPGGGYVLSSVHNIQANVPPENIIAMFEAAQKYGKYPIMPEGKVH